MVISREAYANSRLDIDRLNAYARKVAEACGPFPGGRRLLESRTWTKVERRGSFEETYEERTYFYLLDDGRLIRQYKGWRECLDTSGRGVRYWEDSQSEGERPFEQNDYLLFDYNVETRQYGALVTDREPGRRLLHHAKGVGLSLRLKAVLESGRASDAAPPASPSVGTTPPKSSRPESGAATVTGTQPTGAHTTPQQRWTERFTARAARRRAERGG